MTKENIGWGEYADSVENNNINLEIKIFSIEFRGI